MGVLVDKLSSSCSQHTHRACEVQRSLIVEHTHLVELNFFYTQNPVFIINLVSVITTLHNLAHIQDVRTEGWCCEKQ